MRRLYEITPEELKAVVSFYRFSNPFMTPARIYARWKSGKLNLLKDYKIWPKDRYIKLCQELQSSKS